MNASVLPSSSRRNNTSPLRDGDALLPYGNLVSYRIISYFIEIVAGYYVISAFPEEQEEEEVPFVSLPLEHSTVPRRKERHRGIEEGILRGNCDQVEVHIEREREMQLSLDVAGCKHVTYTLPGV